MRSVPRSGALIGLGSVARQAHLPGFRSGAGVAERLRVVATVDGLAGPGVADVPHFTDRARLAELPIQFIDVCTPTASHLELTLWGLERGYHVLCEKPVALSACEVAQIRAAAGARRVVMPCHQYRYNPAWRQLRAWLDAGAIGEWHLAEFQVYRPGADLGAGGRNETPWRVRRTEARGGILLDHGTHLIYQLLDLAGLPRSVQSWAGRLRHRGYEVEDTAHLLLEFDNRLAVFFLTWASDRRETRIRLTGSDGSIEWSGGTLRLSGRNGPMEMDFTAELEKSCYYRWFAGLFHEFADRIDCGDGTQPMEDIARVTHVLEAAYGAHADGCRVTL